MNDSRGDADGSGSDGGVGGGDGGGERGGGGGVPSRPNLVHLLIHHKQKSTTSIPVNVGQMER